jgi:hypothetical protein
LSRDELNTLLHRAMWTISISTVIIITNMTGIALLDQPMDESGTLLISNRYIRLSSRAVYAVIMLCLPMKRDISFREFQVLVTNLLLFVLCFEWVASMDREWGFLEPKGLTKLMQKEQSRNDSAGVTQRL